MKSISNKEYEAYEQYKTAKVRGEVLTVDGLRFICEANGWNAERIGQHMIEAIQHIERKRKERYIV